MTNRGEEACECARKAGYRPRPVRLNNYRVGQWNLGQHVFSRILAKTRQVTNRNLIEADVAGELAADSETEPEELAEVDQALGRGQITCSRRPTLVDENVPYLGRSQTRTRE